MEPFETLFSFPWWVYLPTLIVAYVSGTFATSAFCGYMTGNYPPDQLVTTDHYGCRLAVPQMNRSSEVQKLYDFWRGTKELAPIWPFMGIAAMFYLVFHTGFYNNYKGFSNKMEERQSRLAKRKRDQAFMAEHDALEAKEQAFLKDETGKVDPLTSDELRRISDLSAHLGIQKAIEAPKKTVVAPDEVLVPKPMGAHAKLTQRRNYS